MTESLGDKTKGAQQQPVRAKRVRSPNYPGVNLESAIRLANDFYKVERRNSANVAVAVRHWGFNSRASSGGIVSVAALKSFGLIDDSGAGSERQVKLSDLGFKIVIDERNVSAERDAAIKEAALRPNIYAKLWNRWKNELPSDENFRHVLLAEHRFNEKAVQDFIRKYKETITFAKLQDSDGLSTTTSDINGSEEQNEQEAQPMPEAHIPPAKLGGSIPSLVAPPGSKPVGASIPVTRECSMTVMASGPVTQKGIDQLMAYLKLVRDSFPEN
ncbi:MAG: hypothetical protein ACRD3T_13935 [Terriglobia bacterium]